MNNNKIKAIVATHPKAKTFREIELDISEKACKSFGFLYEDKVITIKGENATIKGVSPNDDGEDVLWYSIDRLDDQICHYEDKKNLAETGFILAKTLFIYSLLLYYK